MARNIKTIEDLKNNAWVYLPSNLTNDVKSRSIYPKMIKTQESFLSILKIANSSPTAWKSILEQTESISANYFVEHLCVLANVGGEPLARIASNFESLFPDGTFTYKWNGDDFLYSFKNKKPKWSNKSLSISEDKIDKPVALTPDMEDVIMVLFFAGLNDDPSLPESLQRCTIGQYLGNAPAIDLLVKQRYIEISPILKGRDANNTGYVCESSVFDRLKKMLPVGYKLINKGTIPGVRSNNKDVSFDAVIIREHDNAHFGCEIMFQITTNSVIERKANEAEDRYNQCHRQGHFSVNIVDGAGCFQRESALKKLIRYCDCCINMSDQGLESLVEFVKTAVYD